MDRRAYVGADQEPGRASRRKRAKEDMADPCSPATNEGFLLVCSCARSRRC